MTALRLAAATAVFVVLLLGALSNTDVATVRFLRAVVFEAPLAFIVFAAFAGGVAAGLAAGAWRNARLKRALQRARRDARAGAPAPAPHGAAPDDALREPPREVT